MSQIIIPAQSEEEYKQQQLFQQLLNYRDSILDMLNKWNLKDILVTIAPPKQSGDICSFLFHDNKTGANFELIVARGLKDIKHLMPMLISKIAELRGLNK